MKRVILSRDKEDDVISNWLKSFGIEVLPSSTRMDSWIDGIVIGGGKDPGLSSDLNRDKMELNLISNAVRSKIPVLGICRGAEIVTAWGKGSTEPIKPNLLGNHQSCWHRVIFSNLWPARETEVWSHHHLRISNTGNLKAVAFSEDGSIEAVMDFNKRVLGVMWHPERSATGGTISVFPWLKWIEKRF